MNKQKIFTKGSKYANDNWNIIEKPNEHDNAREDFIAGALWVLQQMNGVETSKEKALHKHIVSIALPSDKNDEITIYAGYDKSKWAVAGYGIIKEPFDNPQDALKSILAERQ